MITFDYRGGGGVQQMITSDYRGGGGSPKYYIKILILVIKYEHFT